MIRSRDGPLHGSRLGLSTVNGGHPWCLSCGWNLDRTTPAAMARPAAAPHDGFAALPEGSLSPRTRSAARAATLTAAIVLLTSVPAIAVLGFWLLVSDFFSCPPCAASC